MSRPLLVVEDPAFTAGLNERIHWSLFSRLNPYERRDPNLNEWELAVQDWA